MLSITRKSTDTFVAFSSRPSCSFSAVNNEAPFGTASDAVDGGFGLDSNVELSHQTGLVDNRTADPILKNERHVRHRPRGEFVDL